MVQNLLYRGSYMASIDLQDAYFLVPIAESHRKYLRFCFNSVTYEFTCLCFGLNVAPYIFTKILKPVTQHLRLQGVLLVIYLDDILIFGKTVQDCLRNIRLTKQLLESLGFLINIEKSVLIPSQELKYLGFCFNSRDLSMSLPEEKTSKMLKLLCSFRKKETCHIRELAQLIGTLVSICPAITYGRLHIKTFERHKYLWLKKRGGSYKKLMPLPHTLNLDFNWWINTLKSDPKIYFKPAQFALEIYTDASLTGWGAFCNNERTHGFWTKEEAKFHINYLELLAAFYGLRSFSNSLNNCRILLRLDNTTAISYINRMGGVKYKNLNFITFQIWGWCETKQIFLTASYINTLENKVADKESRSLAVETEYSLSSKAFRKIIDAFGTPEVDLFASKQNSKCPKYVSWHRDPDSFTIDAFTISWKDMYFYAFPPFPLIPKVLNKIIVERATGLLVVPHWPAQAWYPLFKQLSLPDILYLEPSKSLLLSPFREPHPLNANLTLAVGKLCGVRFN